LANAENNAQKPHTLQIVILKSLKMMVILEQKKKKKKKKEYYYSATFTCRTNRALIWEKLEREF